MCFPRVISSPTSSFLGCPNHNLKFIRFILFSNCECEDGVAEVLAAGTREFSECFSQGPWPTCLASSRKQRSDPSRPWTCSNGAGLEHLPPLPG